MRKHLISIVVLCGACQGAEWDQGLGEPGLVAQAVTTVAAIDVSYSPGITGLPANVQDALTAVYALQAEGSVASLDLLDGRPCNGDLGITHLSYTDPSGTGEGPFTVDLRCLADHPVITFTPSTYDFGQYTVDIGRWFTVQNKGGVPVTLGALSCTGGDCTRFTVGSNGCTTLDVDQTCRVRLIYAPRNLACTTYNFQATFKFSTNPASTGQPVTVKGSYSCIP